MAWYRINPRYLRQPDPDGLTLAYVSHGEGDTGSLLLHLGHDRAITGFELTYDRFLSGRELFAEWDCVDGLRLGEVDAPGQAGVAGPRYAMTPIVLRHRQPSTADLNSLLAYVKRNADILDPRHCQVVVAALRAGLRRAASLDA